MSWVSIVMSVLSFLIVNSYCHDVSVMVQMVIFLCRWGQVFILDAVANYIPKDEREAQSICERVTPRLAHANSAVVLSAIKVGITG